MTPVRAVLVYHPAGIGTEQPVPIGATDDPRVLQLLAARLLQAKAAEADRWAEIDEGVYAILLAEAERLGRVLRLLVPDPARAALRVVRPRPTGGSEGEPGA